MLQEHDWTLAAEVYQATRWVHTMLKENQEWPLDEAMEIFESAKRIDTRFSAKIPTLAGDAEGVWRRAWTRIGAISKATPAQSTVQECIRILKRHGALIEFEPPNPSCDDGKLTITMGCESAAEEAQAKAREELEKRFTSLGPSPRPEW